MSLDSFNPLPVTSLTTLITSIFLSPIAVKTILKEDFSSCPSGAAWPGAGAAPGTAITWGVAETPNFFSKTFTNSAKSKTESFSISSTIFLRF